MVSTPAFLPGEFHGQRSLAGYSPQGHKELDTSEQLTVLHFNSTWVQNESLTVYFRLSTPAKFCPQISNPSSSTLLDLSRAGGSHYSAKYHRLCSAGPPS